MWYNMSVEADGSRAFSVSRTVVPQLHIVAGNIPPSSRINVRFVGLDNHGKTARGYFAMARICERCGKELTGRGQYNRRFCSMRCYQGPSPSQVCAQCGKQFITSPCHIRRGIRFCSIECVHEAQRKQGQETLATRYWARVNKTGACWLWTGAKSGGYGNISVNGSTTKAHRISWEWTNGPIPEGMAVLHKCDVRLCVRPDHLFLGSIADNANDMVNKGRQAVGQRHGSKLHPERLLRGEKHQNAKLTNAMVLQIRQMAKDGILHKDIAKRFGVTFSTIWSIVVRKTWKHIADVV